MPDLQFVTKDTMNTRIRIIHMKCFCVEYMDYWKSNWPETYRPRIIAVAVHWRQNERFGVPDH